MLALGTLVLAIGIADTATGNPLLDELLNQGMPANGATLRLLPPVMVDGLDPAAQRKLLEAAADRHPFDLYLRRSDDAPFTIKIESVDDAAGQRVGQKVDVAFVAYGSLSACARGDALDRLLGTAGRKGDTVRRSEALDAAALQRRGLKQLELAGAEERYVRLEFVILDKVLVSGVAHSVRTTSRGSVTAAMTLDPRFAEDGDYPNRWRAINRLADEGEKLGPTRPYAGFGGYARVTELREPMGALFVELHTVFHEPRDWFDGQNVLRSKLPLVTRENIRTFRRALGREPAGE